MTWM